MKLFLAVTIHILYIIWRLERRIHVAILCFIGPDKLLLGAVNFFFFSLLILLSLLLMLLLSLLPLFSITHKPQFFTFYLVTPSRSFQTHAICTLQRLSMWLTLYVCIGLLPRQWINKEFCEVVYFLFPFCFWAMYSKRKLSTLKT